MSPASLYFPLSSCYLQFRVPTGYKQIFMKNSGKPSFVDGYRPIFTIFNNLFLSVSMRKSSSFLQFAEVKRKASRTQMQTSLSSSKLQLSSSNFQTLRPAKGFSFGSAHRNSLMSINMLSPPAKYNIKGLVEINLNAKKGPSIGAGRENSVEKTTLSYIGNNHNPGPGNYATNEDHFKSNASIKIGKRNNQGLAVEFLNNKAIHPNPGPGAYPVKVVKLKGGKLTGQSKRFDDPGKENFRPGPGSYSSTNLDAVSKGGSRVSSKPR